MAGKNGATWRHNWVPTNAAAALLKTHGRSSSFHAFAPAASANTAPRRAIKATPKRAGKPAVKSTEQRIRDTVVRPPQGRAAVTPAWPLERVGRLKSGNEPGLTVAQEYHRKEILGQYSPNDFERARQAGHAHPRDRQAAITAHIAANGLINPAQASEGNLDEGYHRYAAMRELRQRTLPVKYGHG